MNHFLKTRYKVMLCLYNVSLWGDRHHISSEARRTLTRNNLIPKLWRDATEMIYTELRHDIQ